ncbi:response regulator transcription factor [Chitinophagaceae bacterium LB-8]|uniref:Response regulator transcription factor n=1 Tax=Paraflavisolibacter caeni TaxID=2982496 RepID=A0A9X2XYI8_9BACT|nr:response regulator transcription factor [Paraflavisolibacter caeni]MCU7549963.1 response regulator transcription factor [Paraflavisolibacter caeni]
MNNIKVALVDDHVLLRKGLANLISIQGFDIHLECDNGKQLVNKLNKDDLPHIVLMDINMPEMDGFEATLWLKKNYPSVKVLALSMYDDDNAIIRMLRNGAKGYILKESEPSELKAAIDAVVTKGFYYSETVTGKLVHSIQEMDEDDANDHRLLLSLNEKEITFLKLACTEMTYKEIAEQMFLSPRTIDGYRDQLFEKLNVKSRVGLVLFAIQKGIVRFN